MNDLGTASITSMEVAEMTGKIHKNLIRSIETYMKHFSQLNFEPTQYFKLSTYLDEQEKERKCYNITKKGCEFIAHKMTRNGTGNQPAGSGRAEAGEKELIAVDSRRNC